LQRKGRFWFREYFDRYIRNEPHFANAVRYIHENPVQAGLVDRAEDWEFSSAKLWAAKYD
jgi:type I restriction enzyme R subunit